MKHEELKPDPFVPLVFFIWVLVLLLTLVFVGAAKSSDYTFRNNYYWKGNDAYTRQWYQPPLAYRQTSYGYLQGYYPDGYWVYTFSHTYTPPVDYKDPNWRSKLLDVVGQRDKAEQRLRASALEQQYFADAIKLLGLEGNFRIQGYGQQVNYPQGIGGYGNLQLSPAGVQGNTVYGYRQERIIDLYGSVDLNVLYQQASRHTDTAQQLAGQAQQGFSQLVGQAGADRAKVADTIARGQAAALFLQNLTVPSAKVHEVTQVQGSGLASNNPGQPIPQMLPADVSKSYSLWEAHAKQVCGACHTNPERQGAFRVGDWRSYSIEQKIGVVARLVTTDEKRRMPRKEDGSPSTKLSDEQIRLWLSN